jgi:hypothetical protein
MNVEFDLYLPHAIASPLMFLRRYATFGVEAVGVQSS